MKIILTLIFSVIFCINLLAQNTILKDSVTQLKEVIVIDTLTAKNAIGIIPSKIIGASVFNNYSPVDFIGALNQVSGVYALSGALNTNRITIRGVGSRTPFGTDKLRLYYNDIPVTNGTGFSTIEAYDLENLTSVEFIKGPKGTGFGTNLGGAIILNTKQPSNRPTTFTNKTTLGSYGLFKNNLGFSHHQKDLYLSFQYGHMEIDGYRENNRFERDGYLLNSIYSISNKSEIGLLINHIDYSAQIASSINQSDFDEDPTQAAFTWKNSQGYEDNNYSLIGVSHTYRPTINLTNTSSVFYTYLDHYEPRPFNILDEYTNGFGFRSLFSGNFNAFQKNLSYTIGGELYKDEYTWAIFENLYEQNNGNGSFQGDRLNDNKEFRTQINGFATLGYSPLKNLAAQIGLNINKTQYDFRDRFTTGEFNKSAQRNFKTLLLPSLDLKYTATALSQIYVNISRGYSNPSLEETLTPEGVINPDIKQEIGMNYEVGTKLTDREQRMHLNIAIYLMPINNLLVAKRIGEDQYIGRNAGKTEHKGLDIDWNYVFKISPRISIAPFLNYSFSAHRFVEFEDEEAEQDYAGNSLTGVPKHRINFGLQTSYGNGFFANLTHQFVDRIPLTDANSIYSNSFHLLNAKLGYGSPINDHLHLSVQLGVNNITDTKYAQSVLINATSFGGSAPRYFYPGNNTNLYGGVQLKYSL
ncbi:TonB-dependent receptor [Maribacter confluentis]|uniref:TonB-dependent receptor n=1 Tax=Maribacter confluentis TaxID=1656093 RepID=A0ABT8RR55_9FLAO|nr:TonB-dependent receptor [Maribacter confluentis]MDO1512626.1 TonB-dependent receptor [Maribacter confluentis]